MLDVRQTISNYCAGVKHGAIPASQSIHWAVKRHLDDLEHGAERGLWFDYEAVDAFVQFCGLLQHSKGKWAGQPLILEPWQVFIAGCIFGWMRADGFRRFRTVYIEVPRKNGKSTFCAAIGLFGLVADEESGAEVYAAATKRDQAKIVHDEARRMAMASPELTGPGGPVQVYKHAICVEATNSTFIPLSSEANTLEGLNPNMAIIDELHAHKSDEVWNVMENATGAREQPLQFAITTAGADQDGICYQIHVDCMRILDPGDETQDDTTFAFIAAPDKDADWQDEETWRKVNPNYEVSVFADDMKRLCDKAVRIISKQTDFRTKRLNEWVSSASAWIDMAVWDACDGDVSDDDLAGMECWGGLDLASTKDIGSFTLAFPIDDGTVVIRNYSWIPRETADERSKTDNVPYLIWAEDPKTGVKLTPGSRTDFATIEHDIVALATKYTIRNIAVDRWNAEQLRQRLAETEIDLVEFGQGYKSMSPAIDTLERLLLGSELLHGGNPVLRWAVGNVVAETDPNENRKFSKKKSNEKIDPAISMLMAVGVASVADVERDDVGVVMI